MTDYQIQPNTRRCATSGRELQPGEKFYSVLLEAGGKLVRQDFASEVWPGPPSNAFSFWSGRVPTPERGRRLRFDDDLLLDCFQRLEGQSSQISFRYVLALLLMRRKRLKFEEARLVNDQEILQLRCASSGAQHQVVNPRLTEAEMAAVQEDVFRVLGWD